MAIVQSISPIWQEILNMKDDYQQGKAATEYVQKLEWTIERQAAYQDKIRKETTQQTIDNIMRKEPFKTWLKNHDDELIRIERTDWSGMK